MKRLIFLSLLAFIAILPANAWCFVSSCGKTCETVSPDFFPDDDKAMEYYQELDELMCGGKDTPEPDQPEEPVENPK